MPLRLELIRLYALVLSTFLMFLPWSKGQELDQMIKLEPSFVKNLSEENSIITNCFMDMVEGADGRVWFNPCYNENALLSLHLVQYDGYQFHPINLGNQPLLQTTGTLPCGVNEAGEIFGFTNGKLRNVVFLVDPETNKVRFFNFEAFPIEDLQIRNMVLGKSGKLLILVSGKQSLHLFSIENDTIIPIIDVDVEHPVILGPKIELHKLLLLEREGQIWFMSDELPLFCYHPQSGNIRKYGKSFFPSGLENNTFDRVNTGLNTPKLIPYQDRMVLFLPAYAPSLFSVDPQSDKLISTIEHFPADWQPSTIAGDKKGNLLYLFSNKKDQYHALLQNSKGEWFDYSAFFREVKNLVYNVFSKDFFQQLFICEKNNLRSIGVNQLAGIQAIPLAKSRGTIGALFNKEILLYSNKFELRGIDSAGNLIEYSKHSLPDASCVAGLIKTSNRAVRSIFTDGQGKQWFFQSDNIIEYNPLDQSCRSYPVGIDIIRLCQINEETLAFLTEERIPYLFDKKSKQVQRIDSDIEPPGFVSFMHATADSILWMPTSGGLWKIDARTHRSEVIGFDAGFQDFRFQAIQEDSEGKLWLGSMMGGIHVYDRFTRTVRLIDQSQGLGSNVVMSLIKDDEDIMWAGTKNGLSLISPEGKVLATLTKDDGLPDNKFRRFGASGSPDGKLLFTTENGVALIDADRVKSQLHDRENTGKVFLTNLSYFDEEREHELTKTGAINPNEIIVLPAVHRYLKVKMALSSYISPDKNHYAYMLEGKDEDWTYVGNQHELYFNHLPAGKYRLIIKGADYRNNWTEEPLVLSIYAREFFYKQYWFYALILGSISLVGFLWIRRLRLEKGRLEAKVRQRTQQILQDKEVIEQQAKELLQLNELKSRFFTNISHELRTPITLITAPVEQLLRQQSPSLSKRVQNGLRMVLRNGGNLLRMVEELLDLSRLEANKIKLKETPTPLALFCRQLFSAFESKAALKKIHYSFLADLPEEAHYWIDCQQLEKILNNLLANAIKFTPEGGRIQLSLHRVDDMVQFRVKDTGRGILAEDLLHVFDRYFQTQNNSIATEGGTGIGLALSKELTKLMKGDLTVESEWGKGSLFCLKVPLRLVSDSEMAGLGVPLLSNIVTEEIFSPAGDAVIPKGQRPEILIVEDNPDMQALLCGLLKETYECHLANDGAEAWEQLNNENFPVHFDLILSDIMMPKMDGYALLNKVKKHPEWQNCPVVMLTARTDAEDKLQALRLGVDDYLLKPFSPAELLARVSNLIANYRQRQAYLEEERANIDLQFESMEPADQTWLSDLEAAAKTALDKKIDLSKAYLAHQMTLSERQLLRRLKSLTGLTVNKYILEVKLQKARHLLENKSYTTISEVAYASGFKTPGYFSKVFENHFGKRASEYLNISAE